MDDFNIDTLFAIGSPEHKIKDWYKTITVENNPVKFKLDRWKTKMEDV